MKEGASNAACSQGWSFRSSATAICLFNIHNFICALVTLSICILIYWYKVQFSHLNLGIFPTLNLFLAIQKGVSSCLHFFKLFLLWLLDYPFFIHNFIIENMYFISSYWFSNKIEEKKQNTQMDTYKHSNHSSTSFHKIKNSVKFHQNKLWK